MAEHDEASLIERVRREVKDGGEVDCAPEGKTVPDDLKSLSDDDWGRRTIPAWLIVELCTHGDASDPRRGVWLRGAQVSGKVELEWSNIRVPLHFDVCRFDDLNLYAAHVREMIFKSCVIENVWASELESDHSVMFLDCHLGRVDLKEARISGSVRLSNARLAGESGHAFLGDRLAASVVDFNRATVKGELRLLGAKVGTLRLNRSRLYPAAGHAFVGDGLSTTGDAVFSNARVKGELRLARAQIGGNLSLEHAIVSNRGGNAFVGDGLSTGGDAHFEHAGVRGELRLAHAQIRGDLSLANATLTNDDGMGLVGDLLSTTGDTYFDHARVRGELRLAHAHIGGNLSMYCARLTNPTGDAFVGDGLSTKGNVRLNEASVRGRFRMARASVAAKLVLENCNVTKRDKREDEVESAASGMMGRARMAVRRFLKKLGIIKRARAADTTEDDAGEPEVDLTVTSAGEVDDNPLLWPKRLYLDGFSYGLPNATDSNVDSRLDWIKRNHVAGRRHFSPGVYDQLALAYRSAGQDGAARKVLIAREVERGRSGQLNPLSRLWNGFLGVAIKHGYQPWRIVVILVLAVVVSAVLFAWKGDEAMAPRADAPEGTKAQVCTGDYQCFSAPVYSIDVLLPVVDLHQESNWWPNRARPGGWLTLAVTWVLVVIGWLLTTALVAAIGKLWRD
jgi:hypothetical protein